MTPPRLGTSLLLAVAAGLVLATDAGAQVLQPPPRSAPVRRAGEATRPTHQFALNLNALTGYDDNLFAEGEASIGSVVPERSSLSSVFSGGAEYRFGTETRYFETTGRGYTNTFTNLEAPPMYGGDGGLGVVTPIGRRVNITASASGRYEPGLTIGGDGVGAGQLLASTDPSAGGVSDLRTTAGDGFATVNLLVSPRQRVTAGYRYLRSTVTADVRTDASAHMASVGHSWDLRSSVGVNVMFERSHHVSEAVGELSHWFDSDTFSAGLQVRKRLSQTRRLSLSGGARASRVETINSLDGQPFDYVSPSGFGEVRLDFGRTWALFGDFRRDVQTLEGITLQSFMTDALAFGVGGNLAPTFVLALNGWYSRGRPHEGDVGSFESRGATAQLHYILSRCCALLGSYTYYAHRLQDISTSAREFPIRYDRNTLRLGVTIRMPLVGRPAERRTPAGERD